MHKTRVKMCWIVGSILHAVICIHILYEPCIDIVYIGFMIYTFCRSEVMYIKCIQNVYKMYSTFRQPFVYNVYIKFSCHGSFNFVYKMNTNVCRIMWYILYTFWINQLDTCTIFYIQNVCAVSVWLKDKQSKKLTLTHT